MIPVLAQNDKEIFTVVRQIVGDALQLGVRQESLEKDTPLIGNLPELDSMAVLTVISALEEYFQFTVEDDDDISEAFSTMASLSHYVEQKLLH